MARGDDAGAAERAALSAFARPRDWADVAALFDRTLRVFSDVVRPALRGLPASKLSHSNLLLLVAVASDTQVRQADLIRDANLIASNAGYALKALRDAGYVEVDMDPNNRRLRIVTATEEGRRVAGIIRGRCRLFGDKEAVAEFAAAADRFERGLRTAGARPSPKMPPRAEAPRAERQRRSAPEPVRTSVPAPAAVPSAKPAVQAVSAARPSVAPVPAPSAPRAAPPPAASQTAAAKTGAVSGSSSPAAPKPPGSGTTSGATSGQAPASRSEQTSRPAPAARPEPELVPTLFGLEPGKFPRRRPAG